MVGTRNTPAPSQLSTFQMSEEERSSQLEMLTGPRPKIDNSKAYLIAVIMVLLCAVGVLVFLLAM